MSLLNESTDFSLGSCILQYIEHDYKVDSLEKKNSELRDEIVVSHLS